MNRAVTYFRAAQFVWRWRKNLYKKVKKCIREIHDELKTEFNIPQSPAALYKTPIAFLISLCGYSWVAWAVKNGHANLALHFMGKIPPDNIDLCYLKEWIQNYPKPISIDCIVSLVLSRQEHIQQEIFEYVTRNQFHYYSNKLADFVVNENAYFYLVEWKHTHILQRITPKYDPSFLCWIGLVLKQQQMFDDHYPLSNHDAVASMVQNRKLGRGYLSDEDKEHHLHTLNSLQREKLLACIEDLGATKKRKL